MSLDRQKVLNGVSIYSDSPSVVMYVNGVKCQVTVDIEHDEDSGMPIHAKVEILFEGFRPLTPSGKSNCYYKFGGWPEFTQLPIEPMAEDGTPYTYICSVNNNWGDMGNANVFALVRYDAVNCWVFVEDVYVEASCH